MPSSTSSLVIAIDGPAGAGKSTVAKLIAASLDLALLDTGAMYRAVALISGRLGVPVDDERVLAGHAANIEIQFLPGDPQRVVADGEDVTEAIRQLEIGQRASEISTLPAVRKALVAKQQKIVAQGGYVLEGRDVTTVVAPNATLKVFLTASIEERARRRWVESQARGEATSLQEVVKDVVQRDHRDYTRSESPLQLAEDAIIVESYGLTPNQVADRIVSLLEG